MVKPITKAEPKQSVGIDAAIRENWDKLVKELATMDVPENDQETPQPKILSISPDGEALLLKLSHSIAAMINRNRDDWGPLWKAWIKRFEAFTIRIATYFHAARYGSAYIDHKICAQDIRDAGAVTTYFKDQADHVLNDRTENEQERNERLVKAFLDKQEAGKRLMIRNIDRNMTRAIKSDAKIKRSTKIATAIDALMNDGYSLERVAGDGTRATFVKR